MHFGLWPVHCVSLKIHKCLVGFRFGTPPRKTEYTNRFATLVGDVKKNGYQEYGYADHVQQVILVPREIERVRFQMWRSLVTDNVLGPVNKGFRRRQRTVFKYSRRGFGVLHVPGKIRIR